MPVRAQLGLVHVSKAPTHSGEFVPIRVTEMTLKHARWWQEHVQPYIDDSAEARADQGWRWPRIYATRKLVAGTLLQRPTGLVAGVILKQEFIPVCMVLMVEAYRYLRDPSLESVFVWYATRCPDHVLRNRMRVAPDGVPKRLMEITIDLAITHSYNLMLRGRIGLHAASEGGDDLCAKYESFGLIRLDRNERLPPGVRGWVGNDGRYFYHSEESALRASQRLDKVSLRDS
jgi:hypothetical protein